MQPSNVKPSEMSPSEFLAAFGSVYEHSPWVAQGVLDHGALTEMDCPETLSRCMAGIVAAATYDQKLALLGAHPDLAGRLAQAGKLTVSSTNEQAAAGLDQCSAQELARFQQLNQAYTKKFGFPFIIAVSGLNRRDILKIFERRVANTMDAEFNEALAQVDKIALIRISKWFENNG